MVTAMNTDLAIPDDALQDLVPATPELNDAERMYAYWRTLAVPPREAGRRSGFNSPQQVHSLEHSVRMRQALARMQESLEVEYRVTRSRVQAIILEAIEMARRRDQAKVMIEGARALAEISGMNAPMRLQIDSRAGVEPTNATAGVILASASQGHLESLVGVRRALPALSVVKHDD
jgi:hypothetical protein